MDGMLSPSPRLGAQLDGDEVTLRVPSSPIRLEALTTVKGSEGKDQYFAGRSRWRHTKPFSSRWWATGPSQLDRIEIISEKNTGTILQLHAPICILQLRFLENNNKCIQCVIW